MLENSFHQGFPSNLLCVVVSVDYANNRIIKKFSNLNIVPLLNAFIIISSQHKMTIKKRQNSLLVQQITLQIFTAVYQSLIITNGYRHQRHLTKVSFQMKNALI